MFVTAPFVATISMIFVFRHDLSSFALILRLPSPVSTSFFLLLSSIFLLLLVRSFVVGTSLFHSDHFLVQPQGEGSHGFRIHAPSKPLSDIGTHGTIRPPCHPKIAQEPAHLGEC